MARAPVAKPSPDMIRDTQIAELGKHAVDDGAISAAIIYERAGGQVVIRGYNGSRTGTKGLLREAAQMEGMIDE
ncbi:MAG TPA: hypothetical protein PLO16_15700 [Acidocella sp.]|nr:hypothetical protein [Acidocella sp.]